MSYDLSESAFHRLYQARNAVRLLKHSTQEAADDATLQCSLLASYLTLVDEQLSSMIDEAAASLSNTQ